LEQMVGKDGWNEWKSWSKSKIGIHRIYLKAMDGTRNLRSANISCIVIRSRTDFQILLWGGAQNSGGVPTPPYFFILNSLKRVYLHFRPLRLALPRVLLFHFWFNKMRQIIIFPADKW
jgi:hypothetical protein